MSSLSRHAPSFKNGKPNGLKVFAFKPGSFLHTCGFRSGDVIFQINGMPVTSPDKIFEEIIPNVRQAR
ncbi:PDZ domain-containing protein [Myxococcota bacterium]